MPVPPYMKKPRPAGHVGQARRHLHRVRDGKWFRMQFAWRDDLPAEFVKHDVLKHARVELIRITLASGVATVLETSAAHPAVTWRSRAVDGVTRWYGKFGYQIVGDMGTGKARPWVVDEDKYRLILRATATDGTATVWRGPPADKVPMLQVTVAC